MATSLTVQQLEKINLEAVLADIKQAGWQLEIDNKTMNVFSHTLLPNCQLIVPKRHVDDYHYRMADLLARVCKYHARTEEDVLKAWQLPLSLTQPSESRFQFWLAEGYVTLTYPTNMSEQSREVFIDLLDTFVRTERKSYQVRRQNELLAIDWEAESKAMLAEKGEQ